MSSLNALNGASDASRQSEGRVGCVSTGLARRQLSGTALLVRIGMLGAVAFALMYMEFNLPFFPVFLQYDPSDVPTLIGGFAMGPLAGAAVAALKSAIFFLSGKDEAGVIGTAAALATSLAFVLAAAAVYAKEHNKRGAVLGLGLGVVSMVAVMAVLNYYVFLPAYGVPAEALPATVETTMLFNLVKGLLNSVLTFLVYKKVSPLLHA